MYKRFFLRVRVGRMSNDVSKQLLVRDDLWKQAFMACVVMATDKTEVKDGVWSLWGAPYARTRLSRALRALRAASRGFARLRAGWSCPQGGSFCKDDSCLWPLRVPRSYCRKSNEGAIPRKTHWTRWHACVIEARNNPRRLGKYGGTCRKPWWAPHLMATRTGARCGVITVAPNHRSCGMFSGGSTTSSKIKGRDQTRLHHPGMCARNQAVAQDDLQAPQWAFHAVVFV